MQNHTKGNKTNLLLFLSFAAVDEASGDSGTFTRGRTAYSIEQIDCKISNIYWTCRHKYDQPNIHTLSDNSGEANPSGASVPSSGVGD